jgi:SAM-dependent methyltransferase
MTDERDATRYHGADYQQFWLGPTKRHVDTVERRIIEHALPGGQSIAEIGAGYGRLVSSYASRYRDVFLVEPARSLREQAAATHGETVKCVDASVYALPFADAALDALLMVRVMHHLTDPHAALAELVRVLAPGGVLLFSFSNKRNVGKILKFVAGGANDPFSVDAEQYGEFLIGHHPAFMAGVVDDLGLVPVAQYGVGLAAKFVERLPALGGVLVPPLSEIRRAGRWALSPTLFWLLRKP